MNALGTITTAYKSAGTKGAKGREEHQLASATVGTNFALWAVLMVHLSKVPILLKRGRRSIHTARRLLACLVVPGLLGLSFFFQACATPVRVTYRETSATGGNSGIAEPESEPEHQGAIDLVLTGPSSGLTQCEKLEGFDASLADQAFQSIATSARELYSWTTSEQEEELRANRRVLTVGADPVLGKGIAMDQLTARAEADDAGALEIAVNESFKNFRYAWPNPWATRMGSSGEDYGGRLVRMVLKPDAWIGELSTQGRIVAVYDLAGTETALEEATANAERIAVLYCLHHSLTEQSDSVPFCIDGGSFALTGGGDGYREYIVGNEELIEEWSVGTEAVRDRLSSDIVALTEYFNKNRYCAIIGSDQFNSDVTCFWGNLGDAYLESLAMPNENYVPTVNNLIRLIETLEGDLFELDPLVVRPVLEE